MKLIHYSSSRLEKVHSTPQQKFSTSKPRGLWVSIEGAFDWPSWCHAEDFEIDQLEFAHEVVLTDRANILHLETVGEIDDFHEEYSEPRYGLSINYRGIRWDRLANKFDGIIIAPYQWERRLDGPAHAWYYGWDCASGCLWESTAIDRIVQMGRTPHPEGVE